MPQVCIHDNVPSRQYELRIYFREEDNGYALASSVPYGSDKDEAGWKVKAAALEASVRLNIPWIEDADRMWRAGGAIG